MEGDNLFITVYMVGKLLKKAEYLSPLTGKVMEVEFKDIEGYIPVYRTLLEANANSSEGKFAVIPIRIPKE